MSNHEAKLIAKGQITTTRQEQLLAWGYLIKTGMYLSLGAWYANTGQRLISEWVISPRGEVLIEI